jgi:hypothetical protein
LKKTQCANWGFAAAGQLFSRMANGLWCKGWCC